MSEIIKNQNQNSRTAKEKKADALNALGEDLAIQAGNALRLLDSKHRQSLSRIWDNPLFTPEEAFSILGNTAAARVIGSVETTSFLCARYASAGIAYAPWVTPQGVTLILNQDGTVTVVRE